MVLPTGIATTGWPAVRDKCRDIGIRFQRWQDGAGYCILAKREDGLYAAGIGGVVMSIPRQVGKTFLIGAIAFALCLLFPGLTVLWTAHRARTANETFRSMQGMARRKAIRPFIEMIRRGSSEPAIEFKNGSRILFGAREKGFGRGFANVGLVIFDEGQILTDDALDDMVPAANQATNPLVIFTGTPPKPTDPSEVFSRLRAKALDGLSENVLYIEFSADKECDPTKWPRGFVDWVQVAKANPSFPKWTPRAAIMRMLELLGLASFRLEGLGIWDDDGAIPPTIGKVEWGNLKTEEPPTAGRTGLGVKFSLDSKRVAIAAAVKPEGGKTHVEVIGVYPLNEGLALAESWIVQGWRGLSRVAIDGKAGRETLHGNLTRARVPDRTVPMMTVAQVMDAHTTILTAAQDSTLTHANQAGLNASVAGSTQRKIGTLGGWGWEPIGDGDPLPLDAATLAVWAAVTGPRTTGSMPRQF